MKKYGIFMIGMLLFAPFTSNAFSGQGCAGDCRDCHKLEQKEAEAIVKKVAPDGRVAGIKLSPVKSLWQIDVEGSGGKRGALYLDFSKQFLVAGQIVPLEAVGKPAAQKKINFSKLPLRDALVMGPKGAKKKVAVFTDPDCPYCQKLHAEIKQVLEKRKDVAFFIFLRPLPMHKDAPKKVEAILCRKSTALLDDALTAKPVPEASCPEGKAQMEKNIRLAESLDFRGTPTLVRQDGAVHSGFLPADQLSNWIDGK